MAARLSGQSLTAGLLAGLTARPEVWSKTVFILNYDENDGLFDHVPRLCHRSRPTWARARSVWTGK